MSNLLDSMLNTGAVQFNRMHLERSIIRFTHRHKVIVFGNVLIQPSTRKVLDAGLSLVQFHINIGLIFFQLQKSSKDHTVFNVSVKDFGSTLLIFLYCSVELIARYQLEIEAAVLLPLSNAEHCYTISQRLKLSITRKNSYRVYFTDIPMSKVIVMLLKTQSVPQPQIRTKWRHLSVYQRSMSNYLHFKRLHLTKMCCTLHF